MKIMDVFVFHLVPQSFKGGIEIEGIEAYIFKNWKYEPCDLYVIFLTDQESQILFLH